MLGPSRQLLPLLVLASAGCSDGYDGVFFDPEDVQVPNVTVVEGTSEPAPEMQALAVEVFELVAPVGARLDGAREDGREGPARIFGPFEDTVSTDWAWKVTATDTDEGRALVVELGPTSDELFVFVEGRIEVTETRRSGSATITVPAPVEDAVTGWSGTLIVEFGRDLASGDGAVELDGRALRHDG